MPISAMAVKRKGAALVGRAAAPTSAGQPTKLQAALLLAVLAFLVYGNSLQNSFVFDDNMLITQAREVASLAQFLRAFEWELRRPVSPSPDEGVSHRPVRNAALAAEYHFFGSNPVGYRTVNILLHALNGLLVFVILRALIGRARPALYAAVLFIVHPVQTESVAYIAGQRDVLFTIFYLLGFLGYVRYRATARTGYLGLAGLAYLLGLFTKEMAITLPLLCLAYDLLHFAPGTGGGIAPPFGKALRTSYRVALERSKWLYLIMGTVLALLLFYFVVAANPSHQRTLYGGGLGPTLLTSARIVAYYLKQMIFPLTLNADSYAAFQVTRSFTDPRGLLALFVLTGLWYGLFRGLRADRWITFGGVWFFLTLLPISQIIPHQELVAEHFLYMPSVGFCLVVSLFIERGLALPLAGRGIAAVSVCALLLLGARTILRNRDWKDELTLWTKAAQAAPHSYWAHQRLGDAYKSLGRYEEAIREYKAVQDLTPGYATEYIAIGDCLRRLGKYDEAVDQFRKALAISPDSIAARLGLAHTYLAMGLLERAQEVHQPIARFLSKAAQEFRRTGDARMTEGRAAEAVMAYRNGLEVDPLDPSLHVSLARAYTAMGLHEQATEAHRKALQLDPTLGSGKGRSGEFRRATATGVGPTR